MRIRSTAMLLLLAAVPAAAQDRGVIPEDYYRMVSVGDVAVAPHGELVAFTVTTVKESDNRRHSEIWMQQLRRGEPVGEPFRFTDPTRSSRGPRWSPDGSVLGFNSRRDRDAGAVWFMRVTAPGGEAYRIEGVEGTPVWSPDGAWIAYTRAPDGDGDGNGEPGSDSREGWIAPDAVTRTLDATRFDGRVITHMAYKRDGTLSLLPHPSIREKSQLFVVPAGGGEPRRLTDLPFNVRGVEWTPDGRTLLFTGNELEDDEHADELTLHIYAVPFEGGEVRRLTDGPGSHASPVVSPGGDGLAFVHTPERGAVSELHVVPVGRDAAVRGESRRIAADWELGFAGLGWTPDGRRLRFGSAIRGAVHLFDVPAGDGEVRQITTGERRLGSVSFSADGSVMAYTATDAAAPVEVFVARADGSDERRVTRFNDEWLARVRVMPAERLTWTVSDGTEIEGWLLPPVDYRPGGSYPMVLKIHGGPHTAYGNTFFQAFHVLSGAGMFVLYPNPRGSSAYGHEFMYATRGQWGELDQEDLLTGVDAALARYPEIDPERLGVSGGSYGGFMTNWLTARTDRFAAAVTSRSITNWESWYGTSDAQRLTEYEFYGPPWEQRELYRRLSPISYVEHVTAPTLIIHSENDHRTPMADAEQWFMALKKRQVPVEFVRYPRSSHGLSRTGEPWLLVDRLERTRSWFHHWLIEAPARAVAEE